MAGTPPHPDPFAPAQSSGEYFDYNTQFGPMDYTLNEEDRVAHSLFPDLSSRPLPGVLNELPGAAPASNHQIMEPGHEELYSSNIHARPASAAAAVHSHPYNEVHSNLPCSEVPFVSDGLQTPLAANTIQHQGLVPHQNHPMAMAVPNEYHTHQASDMFSRPGFTPPQTPVKESATTSQPLGPMTGGIAVSGPQQMTPQNSWQGNPTANAFAFFPKAQACVGESSANVPAAPKAPQPESVNESKPTRNTTQKNKGKGRATRTTKATVASAKEDSDKAGPSSGPRRRGVRKAPGPPLTPEEARKRRNNARAAKKCRNKRKILDSRLIAEGKHKSRQHLELTEERDTLIRTWQELYDTYLSTMAHNTFHQRGCPDAMRTVQWHDTPQGREFRACLCSKQELTETTLAKRRVIEQSKLTDIANEEPERDNLHLEIDDLGRRVERFVEIPRGDVYRLAVCAGLLQLPCAPAPDVPFGDGRLALGLALGDPVLALRLQQVVEAHGRGE